MGRLLANGINQADLVDMLVLIRTNLLGIQTKLDSDSLVSDTNYHTLAATLPATVPSGIQTTGPKCIRDQGAVVSMLNDLITKLNATLTKLDSDGGVTGTNYNSLWAVTDVVGNSAIDGIFDAGVYQSCLINVLNSLLSSINGLCAKLDLDTGVTDTNYASLWAISDTVDESGSRSRVRISGWIIGFLTLASLLGGRPQPCYAASPVFAVTSPESNYSISHSSVSFSSFTVYSLSANSHYQKLIVQDITGATSFYFTISASTANITTIGRLVPSGAAGVEIESNGQMNFLLSPSVAATTYRIMKFEK